MEFTPNSIHKFDTYIQVNVRGSKTVSLRVGGTIEPPCVDIDVVSRSDLQSFFFFTSVFVNLNTTTVTIFTTLTLTIFVTVFVKRYMY